MAKFAARALENITTGDWVTVDIDDKGRTSVRKLQLGDFTMKQPEAVEGEVQQ